MWLCFIYGEMQPSGFPKASANSARRCLKPSERHCALPFQRHPSSGAGLVVLGAAGGEHQPAQHDTGSMILWFCDLQQGWICQEKEWGELRNRASSKDVSLLGLPTYFLLHYWKSEWQKKNPLDLPKEEMKREILRFLIPPESPLAGCKRGHRGRPQPRRPGRPCTASILISIRKYNHLTTKTVSFLSPCVASEGFLNKTLSCFWNLCIRMVCRLLK